MIKRTYAGGDDLKLLQDFNSAAIAETEHCGYLHPGDIPHHLFNGNNIYDPAEIMTIWQDDQGVAAWLLVEPGVKGFEAQVRPDLRGGDFERDVLLTAQERTVDLLRRYRIATDCIFAGAWRGDKARQDLLIALGWKVEEELPYVLTRTEINLTAVPSLPDGFFLDTAKNLDDAPALADVHNGSFGASWTLETYRKVMMSPGYAPERELVVRAPDGTFAAFCITWIDQLNRTGLFEPVGTHKDYRRRGFGRALLLFGLQEMAAAGMKWATVAHSGNNDAAKGLYHACGFRPWHYEDEYKKSIA